MRLTKHPTETRSLALKKNETETRSLANWIGIRNLVWYDRKNTILTYYDYQYIMYVSLSVLWHSALEEVDTDSLGEIIV